MSGLAENLKNTRPRPRPPGQGRDRGETETTKNGLETKTNLENFITAMQFIETVP